MIAHSNSVHVCCAVMCCDVRRVRVCVLMWASTWGWVLLWWGSWRHGGGGAQMQLAPCACASQKGG